MKIATVTHVCIAAAWLVGVVLLSLAIATTGAEEERLKQQRGADMKIRQDLTHEFTHLQTAVEWAARTSVIQQAVAELGLDLAPRRSPADGDEASAVSLAMNEGASPLP